MGRKPKDPEEKKVQITFRFKKQLVDKLKEVPKYNQEVEKLIEEKFDKK